MDSIVDMRCKIRSNAEWLQKSREYLKNSNCTPTDILSINKLMFEKESEIMIMNDQIKHIKKKRSIG